MAQAADFFVSYTSADHAWAEWLARQLEVEGDKVVVHRGQQWTCRPWAPLASRSVLPSTATPVASVGTVAVGQLGADRGEQVRFLGLAGAD